MKKGKVFYGWWMVLACGLTKGTLYTTYVNIIALFIIPISKTFHCSRGEIALSTTIISLIGVICVILMGKLLKPENNKQFVIIGNLMACIGLFMYGLSNSLMFFYLATAIGGIGIGIGQMLNFNVIITNWFEKKRGLALGLMVSSTGIGGAILTQVVSHMQTVYSWKTIYLILAVIGTICALFSFFIIKESPERLGMKPYGVEENIAEKETEKVVSSLYEAESVKEVRLPFIAFILVCMITAGMYSGITNHVPASLTDAGFSSANVGIITSLFLIILIGGKILIGAIFDKVGGKKGYYSMIACVIAAVVCLIFSSKSILLPYGYAILFGIGGGLSSVGPSYLTKELFGNKNYSKFLGYTMGLSFIGAAFASPITGFVYDTFHQYTYAWIGYIVIAVIEALLITYIYRSIRKLAKRRSEL